MLFNCYFENPVIVSRISIIFFILKLKKYFKFQFLGNFYEMYFQMIAIYRKLACGSFYGLDQRYVLFTKILWIFLFHFEFKRLKTYTIMYRRQNTSWGVNLINSFDRIKVLHFFLIAYKCFLFKDHLQILNNFNTRRI